MSWEQIAQLHKDGFEVANHTWTHKNAGKLTASQLTEQLEYIENQVATMNVANAKGPANLTRVPGLP